MATTGCLLLRAIESFSRTWGGAANILVLVLSGDVLPVGFWPALARFDADRLGCYQPTRRGWQMADPKGFDAWLTGHAQQLVARNGGTLDEARALLTQST